MKMLDKGQKGNNLPELLTTMAVIGVLAATAISSYISYINKALVVAFNGSFCREIIPKQENTQQAQCDIIKSGVNKDIFPDDLKSYVDTVVVECNGLNPEIRVRVSFYTTAKLCGNETSCYLDYASYYVEEFGEKRDFIGEGEKAVCGPIAASILDTLISPAYAVVNTWKIANTSSVPKQYWY